MNRLKISSTILFSMVAMGICYGINFFTTWYITENISADAYGYVSLAKQFIVYAGIITIALNSYATRFMAVYYHNNNIKQCNNIFSSLLFADVILGILIIIAFLFITFNIDLLLNVSVEIRHQVKILFFLSGLSFSILTMFTPYNSSAYIKNQLDKVNICKTLSYLFEAVGLFSLFYLMKPKIWFVGVGILLFTFSMIFSNAMIHKRYTPEIIFQKSAVSLQAIKQLVSKGIWNSLNSLGNTLNSGLDLVITNIMLTELAMGQLAIAKTISTIFYALFQLLSQPFQPILLEDYSKNDREKLLKDLKKAVITTGLFSNLAFAGFLALGKLYYELWIPKQDTTLLWILTVITISGSIIEGAVFPLYYIYILTLKNKIPCFITIMGGLLNVISMYALIKYTNLGIYAVVLTTAVIMTVINLFFNPIYMAKCLGIKVSFFYSMLVRHVFSALCLSVLFLLISNLQISFGWLSFFIKSILCCLIGVPIHLFLTYWLNN